MAFVFSVPAKKKRLLCCSVIWLLHWNTPSLMSCTFHAICSSNVPAVVGSSPHRKCNQQTALSDLLQPHDCYINALAFDVLGSHLYAGDAAGAIQEYSVDLSGSCPEPIKKLRSSDDVAGAPIAQLLLHPGAHHLLVLTKRHRLVALDVKMLVVARTFREVRCSSHPLKAAISPGGCGVVMATCKQIQGRCIHLVVCDSVQGRHCMH